jgi:hypothetical protein
MADIDHADAAKYAEIAIESEYKSHANLAACYLDSQAKLEAANTRLENNFYFNDKGERIACNPGDIPDGISARDATIHLQDEALEAERKTVLGKPLSAEYKMLFISEQEWEQRAGDAESRLREVEAVVAAFLKRFDELAPALSGVFTFYAIHGMKWPQADNWKSELDAIRALAPERTEQGETHD